MKKISQKHTLLILVLILIAGLAIYFIANCPCLKYPNFEPKNQVGVILPEMDIPPIVFFEEGYVIDREPDKANAGLYLSDMPIWAEIEPGQPDGRELLVFDEYSYCEFGGQSILCRSLDVNIDASLAGKRVLVDGVLMNGVNVTVRKLVVQDFDSQ